MEVLATDDPAVVLDVAGAHLAGDPVRHNLVLTLLHQRVAHPTSGRYWVVAGAGVVFQSPLTFVATLTPMADEAVRAAVDAVVDAAPDVPGVAGEAATAARFAGQWTERTRSAARPVLGERIYELRAPSPAMIRRLGFAIRGAPPPLPVRRPVSPSTLRRRCARRREPTQG